MSIVIKPRDQWGAIPPKATKPIDDGLAEVFVHWPATRGTQNGETAKMLRGHQRFHMVDRGWNDIGYSFAVDRAGNVWECRGWNVEGGHTKGHNRTAYGVVFLIDQGEAVPDAMVDAFHEWLAFAVTVGKVSPGAAIRAHSDVRATECPGPALRTMVELVDNVDRSWSEGRKTSRYVTADQVQAMVDEAVATHVAQIINEVDRIVGNRAQEISTIILDAVAEAGRQIGGG